MTNVVLRILTPAAGLAADQFGLYVVVKADGSEIAVSRQRQPQQPETPPLWVPPISSSSLNIGNRGAVVTYQRPGGVWAATGTPDQTYTGLYQNANFGFETTYDKSNNDLWSAATTSLSGQAGAGPIWQITDTN